MDVDVLFGQRVPKGLDGSGDAVDAGEVNIGDHEDSHGQAWSPASVSPIFQMRMFT
jgi:hypothetical protein